MPGLYYYYCSAHADVNLTWHRAQRIRALRSFRFRWKACPGHQWITLPWRRYEGRCLGRRSRACRSLHVWGCFPTWMGEPSSSFPAGQAASQSSSRRASDSAHTCAEGRVPPVCGIMTFRSSNRHCTLLLRKIRYNHTLVEHVLQRTCEQSRLLVYCLTEKRPARREKRRRAHPSTVGKQPHTCNERHARLRLPRHLPSYLLQARLSIGDQDKASIGIGNSEAPVCA